MTISRDPDVLIREFLEQGVNELPDRSYDVVRSTIDSTRQRVAIGPWREQQVTTFAKVAIAAAVVVLIAVVGIRFLPGLGGVGVQPTATPTTGPTAAPTPSPVTVVDPKGRLSPANIYVAHPFQALSDSLSITFTVPTDSWEAVGQTGTDGLLWYGTTGTNEGFGLGFSRVTHLYSDPCLWSSASDDVAVGVTVDSLVTALTAADDFEASEATPVTVGGFTGQKLIVTIPDPLPTSCDEDTFVVLGGDGFTIYAQSPGNTWTLWILDVDGERLVIQASEVPPFPAERTQQLNSIVESMVIQP